MTARTSTEVGTCSSMKIWLRELPNLTPLSGVGIDTHHGDDLWKNVQVFTEGFPVGWYAAEQSTADTFCIKMALCGRNLEAKPWLLHGP